MSGRLRVLLVDDHELFRSGVKALLARQADIEVVGEAANGLDGVKQARQLRPDIVLLDLHMPGVSGREVVRALTEELPGTRVLMLTVSEDAEDLLDTLRAGAAGYLLKNIDTDYFMDAIRRAADGESVVSPQMTSKLVRGLQAGGNEAVARQSADKGKISPREREVLVLLARGASNKELARELDLAESTVKIHVQNILRKLNLNSRVQAAVYAVEQGMAENNK
ncbi:MAG: response regulator transcription factor [Burkholderiales bacterium]|nr:response regulator transcription factor [Burkholderiales bacterium]MDP2398393.1 response regulator transcription factor [Burkholderiales bacterium]